MEFDLNDFIDNMTGIIVITLGLLFVIMTFRQKEKTRRETLKILLDNGAGPDDPRVEKLLSSNQMPIHSREETYTGLKIGGTICLFLSIGIFFLLLMISYAVGEPQLKLIGIGVSGLLACLATALLFSTRFVAPDKELKDKGIPRD